MNEHFPKSKLLKLLLLLGTAAVVFLLLTLTRLGIQRASEAGPSRQQLLASNSTDALAFSPDGTRLAGGHGLASAELRIWNLKTKQLLHEVRTDHNAGVGLVAFSPDGKTVVSSGLHDDGRLLLWDVRTGKLLGQLTGRQWITNALFFSPDGKYLVNAGHNDSATIEIWNMKMRRLTRVLKGDRGDVATIRPDGKTILSAGTGGAKTWDLQTGRQLKMWPLRGRSGVAGYITAVISPDTKTVAFGKSQRNGQPETVVLWSVQTGKLLHTLPANRGYKYTVNLQDVTFSPDSKTIAICSAGAGEAIKLWDVKTGTLRRTLKPTAYSLAFSSDGKVLAAGSVRRVYLWNLNTTN